MINHANLFENLLQNLPQEVVETLVRTADVRIERIISHGHASPGDFWYHQPQHEWGIVLTRHSFSSKCSIS
jgi:cupin 2 domain-containing protein